MTQYIDKSALVAEICRRLEVIANASSDNNRELAAIHGAQQCELISLVQYINTLEVKEIPETVHTECKKIKKLCEIQRYDEDGEAYSVMLPDIRLFMNKINEIIDAVSNIDSRLQAVEQKYKI